MTVEDDDESVILASQQQLIVREGERGGHSNPGVAAACNLLLDDDDTPYVLCNDRCALESQCDTTPRDECVQSCFAREYWAVVDQSSAGAGHECSTVCMRHGVDSYQYEDDGNCSCLSLRGDASVQQAIQRSSTGNGCTMCSQRAISAADVSVVSELLQATYDLVLLSQPISDMNISITPHGGLQVDPRWVVFNSSSWYMNQEITVWAVDDLVTERFEFAEVLHAVSSSEDPFYGDANFAVQSVDVTVVDDDTARVHLSTASMELNETGQSSAVYSVWLSSPPESNVTVTLHFDEEELTAEPSRLVFSSNTWSVRQEVTVVTVDDMVDSGDLWPTMIAHKVNSDDVFYDDVYTRNISVALLDNDVARVRIAPRNGNVTEGGAHDAYNISLTSEPTANVTVYVLGEALDDQQLRVDPEQLVFIPTNWNQPQMVQVTAVDDDIAEGTTQQFLFHNTSSDDPWYGNAFARPFVVRVTDNDEAVVVETIDDVGPSSNGTTVAVRDSGSDFALYEGGRSARACVTLSAQPLGVVVVQPFVQLCASTARDGNSSAECIPGFDGVVALVECDIEPFNLYRMVDVLRVNSSESGFSSWAVHANEINASGCFGAAVEFLPDTWDMPVCFDIFAPEDNIDEAQLQMRVVYNITSAAVLYNANQTQFGGTLALYDNDDAGIALVDEIDLVVSEAGLEATYEIRLTSQPLEDVTIYMHHTGHQLIFSPPNLTFSHEAWNATQMVRLSAVDDQIDEGENSTIHVWHTTASADPMYADSVLGRLGNVTVTVEDDDEAGVTIFPEVVQLVEVSVYSSVPFFAQLDGDFNLLAANQTCRDLDMELADVCCESHASHLAVASSECIMTTPGYCLHRGWSCSSSSALSANKSVCEEPSAGSNVSSRVLVREQVQSLFDGFLCVTDAVIQVPAWFTEQGDMPMQVDSTTTSNASVSVVSELPFPSVVCSIVLNSEPAAEVTVSVESTDDIYIDPNTTKFTSKHWTIPRFFIVLANDDDIAEDTEEHHVLSASAQSEDQYYTIGEAFTLNSTIMDNDAFTVDITVHPQTAVLQGAIQLYESSSSSQAQGQGSNTGSYLVSLGARPSSEVTTRVWVSPEVYGEDVTLKDINGNLVESLTFNAAIWNVKQRIFITAVDDCHFEGREEFLLINSLSSEGRTDVVANVSVVLTDDDEIEVPSSYITHGPRAGPLTGNTTVALTAVVEDEAAFGTNLRAGMIIQCLFTDEYGMDDQTAGFVLNDGPYPADVCIGSAEIRCTTPTWPVAAEGELLRSRSCFLLPFSSATCHSAASAPARSHVVYPLSEQCLSKSVLEAAFTWASTPRSSITNLKRPPSLQALCLVLRRAAPLSKYAALRLCRPTRRRADLGAG